jgi:hypothetical protein
MMITARERRDHRGGNDVHTAADIVARVRTTIPSSDSLAAQALERVSMWS